MITPENRAVDSKDVSVRDSAAEQNAKPVKTVKVRAKVHLGEDIGGEIQRFAPGQEFELPAARAKVLGHLIEVLK